MSKKIYIQAVKLTGLMLLFSIASMLWFIIASKLRRDIYELAKETKYTLQAEYRA